MDISKPELTFHICKIAGFCLMFVLWLHEGGQEGFFLLLTMVLLSLLRLRVPKLKATILFDGIACVLAFAYWRYAHHALAIVLFEGMYRRYYWVGFTGLAVVQAALLRAHQLNYFDFNLAALAALGALCGLFLGKWEREVAKKFALRDTEAGKYYKIKQGQSALLEALPQIERMTAVRERARIAGELHDNAGHEIVAAYISFQTMRNLFDKEDAETLELYDAALGRLQAGVEKIRETAHNLQTVTSAGVAGLLDTCQKFSACPVDFRTYGDTSKIPMYVWSFLESCLNESLTNVMRHSRASYVSVELDVTQHIVRFCVENDAAVKSGGTPGIGLSNLRRRAMAVGGSLSIDSGNVFRLVCVIPVKEKEDEIINS